MVPKSILLTYALFSQIIDTRLPDVFAHEGSTIEFHRLKKKIISKITEEELPVLIDSITGTTNTAFKLVVMFATFKK